MLIAWRPARRGASPFSGNRRTTANVGPCSANELPFRRTRRLLGALFASHAVRSRLST